MLGADIHLYTFQSVVSELMLVFLLLGLLTKPAPCAAEDEAHTSSASRTQGVGQVREEVVGTAPLRLTADYMSSPDKYFVVCFKKIRKSVRAGIFSTLGSEPSESLTQEAAQRRSDLGSAGAGAEGWHVPLCGRGWCSGVRFWTGSSGHQLSVSIIHRQQLGTLRTQ